MQLYIVKPIQTQQNPIMKTLLRLIFVLSFSLLATSPLYAGGDEKNSISQQEMAIQKMWKQLNRSIRLETAFCIPGLDVRVEAQFLVKDDGTIEVLEITGAEAELSSSLKRQLQALQLTDPFWIANQTYIVPIHLRYR